MCHFMGMSWEYDGMSWNKVKNMCYMMSPKIVSCWGEQRAKDLGTFDPSSSRRLGILLRQPLKARAAGPPCHISFLSGESNKAKGWGPKWLGEMAVKW